MELLPDKYDMQARVAPAVVILLPIMFCVCLLFPSLIDATSVLMGSIVVLALSMLLASTTRNVGKRKEKHLFERWDGMPTVRFLRHLDTEIAEETKQRYHQYLQANVPGFSPPTRELEFQDKERADRMYGSAVNWLRQQYGSTSFVFSKNVAYGFARNLWGLKPLAITISLLSLAGSVIIVNHRYGLATKDVPVEAWCSIVIPVIFLYIWMFVVSSEWVHLQAKAYGIALLETCDGVRQAS
ncbi:hypothetical protein [Ammoniphilus sp. CFH 90114]|uniref:hypothetical protein n=1 Tax=Ammoniphilus sp. CFH 90114 TaxID=2493665 RepID=UPI00100FE2D4|nr:hypothetical protein [Ammoniphilus sp. CFH 90114]RXT03656.1 hypothetical protein EIZ39_23290 [Ammoniphilus sp. CFH 90114]